MATPTTMEIAPRSSAASEIEKVLIGGDLSRLSAEQRVDYLRAVCKSLGLNPLTQPFAYITLNGKLTLYAKKDCTEQLRAIHGISVRIASRESIDGVYVVTASASQRDGRIDESIGAVSIEGLKGEAKANCMMKSETKAKRRVTLSLCGLGMLDESEIESIPDARPPAEPPPAVETLAEVRDRRIAELKAQAQPEPEVPEPVQKLWVRMGRNKEVIKDVLSELYADLKEVAGPETGRGIFDDICKRYGAGDPVAKVGLARRTVWELWKALEGLSVNTQVEMDMEQEPEVVYAD